MELIVIDSKIDKKNGLLLSTAQRPFENTFLKWRIYQDVPVQKDTTSKSKSKSKEKILISKSKEKSKEEVLI